MGFAEAATLDKGSVFEILRINAQAGGNMIADGMKPVELFWSKRDFDPGGQTLGET